MGEPTGNNFAGEKPLCDGFNAYCAAVAPFRKEPFAQRRFTFALQNRLSLFPGISSTL